MKKAILVVLAASMFCDAIPYGHYNPHRHGSYQSHHVDKSPHYGDSDEEYDSESPHYGDFHHHDWHDNRRIDDPHQYRPSNAGYRWSDSDKYHGSDDKTHSSNSPSGIGEIVGGVQKDVTEKNDTNTSVIKESSTELPKQGIFFGGEIQKGNGEVNIKDTNKESPESSVHINFENKGYGIRFHHSDDKHDSIIPMEHKYGSEDKNTQTSEAMTVETTTETQLDLNHEAGGSGEQINGSGEQMSGNKATEVNAPENHNKHNYKSDYDDGGDVWDFYSEEELLKHYNEYHDHKHHLHKNKNDSLFVHQVGQSNSSTFGGGEISGGNRDQQTVPGTTTEQIETTTALFKELQTGKAEHHHGYHDPCHHHVHSRYGPKIHTNGPHLETNKPQWYSNEDSNAKESKEAEVSIDVRSAANDTSVNTGKAVKAEPTTKEASHFEDPGYIIEHYDYSDYY